MNADKLTEEKPAVIDPLMREVTCSVCFGSGESGEPMDLIEGIGCWHCGGRGCY